MGRSRPINKRHWAVVRLRALDRDDWRCVMCGRAGRLEVDHKVSLKNGGDPYDLSNLQSLCRQCHFAKTAEENGGPAHDARMVWGRYVKALRDE